ncbi:MAG TPA: hypothetical protein VKV30_08755 [Candidatus Angelobacter sp.]|nr:hypothetical protein [Candidatus Angelobacter sp.]
MSEKIFDKLNNQPGDVVGLLLSLRRRLARSCSRQARAPGTRGFRVLGQKPGLACRDAMQRSAHKKSVPHRQHSRSCIQMVYGEFMTENGKNRPRKEETFFELAERFRGSNDPEEVKQSGDELGRLIFGE